MVWFEAYEGRQRVHCFVLHEALAEHAPGTHFDYLQMFDDLRDRVQAAARAKFDVGQVAADGSIRVNREDLSNET